MCLLQVPVLSLPPSNLALNKHGQVSRRIASCLYCTNIIFSPGSVAAEYYTCHLWYELWPRSISREIAWGPSLFVGFFFFGMFTVGAIKMLWFACLSHLFGRKGGRERRDKTCLKRALFAHFPNLFLSDRDKRGVIVTKAQKQWSSGKSS